MLAPGRRATLTQTQKALGVEITADFSMQEAVGQLKQNKSTVNCQLSTVNCQLSTVNWQLANGQWSEIEAIPSK